MRPIDIESRGDLIVLDIDPRTHDVTLAQVAAAVANGQTSRELISAAQRHRQNPDAKIR